MFERALKISFVSVAAVAVGVPASLAAFIFLALIGY